MNPFYHLSSSMKNKRDDQQHFDKVTHDHALEIVAENMPELVERRTLATLRSTCHFFSNHNKLKTQFDSKPWCELAVGAQYTVLLTHEKKLYVSGFNGYGQLGQLEQSLSQFTPSTISLLEKDEYISKIATGLNHTLLLSNKGRLIGSGMNEMGQLGCDSAYMQETDFIIITVEALEQDEHIIGMQSGHYHTVLLTNKGRLLGSGANDCGQLGLPKNNKYCGFAVCNVNALSDNERVIKVVTGMYQTLLLTSQNRLLVAGLNEDMILGVSNEGRDHIPDMPEMVFIQGFEEANINGLQAEDYIIDMAISMNEVFLLTHKGQLLGCIEADTFDKVTVAALQTGEIIKQVMAAMGKDNTFLLTNQGRLLATGSNNWGQLGLPRKIEHTDAFKACELSFLGEGENITHIVAGDDHTLLLTNKARVFGCGNNVYGQLGFTKKESIYGFQECDLGVIKNKVIAEKEEVMQSSCFS